MIYQITKKINTKYCRCRTTETQRDKSIYVIENHDTDIRPGPKASFIYLSQKTFGAAVRNLLPHLAVCAGAVRAPLARKMKKKANFKFDDKNYY